MSSVAQSAAALPLGNVALPSSTASALALALVSSLLLTLIIECGFAYLAGKRQKDMLLVLLANAVTNPAVVLLYWLAVLFTALHPGLVMLLLEVSAFLVEGWYYSRYGSGFGRPFLFSFAANSLSFVIGVLLQSLL